LGQAEKGLYANKLKRYLRRIATIAALPYSSKIKRLQKINQRSIFRNKKFNLSN